MIVHIRKPNDNLASLKNCEKILIKANREEMFKYIRDVIQNHNSQSIYG